MLKIDKKRSSGASNELVQQVPGYCRVEKGSGSDFSRDLVDKQNEVHQQRMQELLQEIDELSVGWLLT